MQVDRGLDPAWASNPGLDRERILADSLAGRLDAADEALARAAVRQVAGSPLLERQLAPMRADDLPKGDLPAAILPAEWRDRYEAATKLARLDQDAARHLRRKHAEANAGAIRDRLQETLDSAQLVLRQRGRGKSGKPYDDIVFFLFGERSTWKAVVTRVSARSLRLKTFYKSGATDVARTESRADSEYLRDERERPG